MSAALLLVQTLNGLQLGVLLFLIAAGLTLVFGVMDFINLAHGVQYMIGAYLAAMFTAWTGSFWTGLLLTLPTALAFGLVLEVALFRRLYGRDHLDQVLVTFALIIFLNQARQGCVGGGAARRAGARGAVGQRPADGGDSLSGLPARAHRRGARDRRPALCAREPDAGRHAGAGRRQQCADGLGARRRHRAAVHDGVRLRRHAGRIRRRHGLADPVGRAGNGRQPADPDVRRHRHRRHRLDPRRARGRTAGRPDRHARPRVRAAAAALS